MLIKKIISLAIIALFCGCYLAQKTDKTALVNITLRVTTAEKISNNSLLTVAGNHPNLGGWQAEKITLTRLNDTVFEKTIQLPKGYDAEFKFTRGFWYAEAVTRTGQVPGNHRWLVRRDTTLSYKIWNWKDVFYKPLGGVTGKVITWENMEGDSIKPRNVHIWLPPNYNDRDLAKHRFPVIYLHDGQNCFDPRTATAGRDWQLDEIADSLIRNKIVEPFIMVAIDNSADRYNDYNYSTLGKKYGQFIVKTLKPSIDAKFHTDPRPEKTTVWGSSMGGLCALILHLDYPNVFQNAACFSPAFKVVKHERLKLDYVKRVKAMKTLPTQHNIYIDNGTLGLEKILQPGIDDMMSLLKKRQYEFVWFLDENAEHNEAAWSKRAWRPFLQFYGLK